MIKQGGSFAQRFFSFIIRQLTSLILPNWGLAMIAVGVRSTSAGWIATGSGPGYGRDFPAVR
jgi:hypothetical protein